MNLRNECAQRQRCRVVLWADIHVSIVVGVFVLVPQTMPTVALVTFDLVFGTALWLVIVAVALANHRHLSRQPFPSTGIERGGRI